MKKYLYVLIGILSFIGISKVKATINYDYALYTNFDNENSSTYTSVSTILSNLYDSLYEEYSLNYSNNYPFYLITLYYDRGDYSLLLYYFDNPVYVYYDINSTGTYHSFYYYNNTDYTSNIGQTDDLIATYRSSDYSYVSVTSGWGNAPYHINSIISYSELKFHHIDYFYSNFDLKLYTSDNSDFVISNYLGTGNSLILHSGDTIPTLQNALNLDIIQDPEENYTEVNLNNYSYIALSLKNYNQNEEFYTNMYVKGNYCLTPVYDYGLKERKDVLTGSRIQSCSPYYNDFTLVRSYILKSDIDNHAIYYLKAYDTTKENKIKIDTSIFNIHYITQQEESNPIININGRNYTTIPYSDLTDSATISESEGYVSGQSCGVGDFNCSFEYNTGISFSEIFTAPLQFFKSLMTAFVSVFSLVATLISVLPLPMQYTFYLSFTLAIALGIIKILL